MNFDRNLNNAQQLFCESVYHPINYISIYSGEKILSGGICLECCCIRTTPSQLFESLGNKIQKNYIIFFTSKNHSSVIRAQIEVIYDDEQHFKIQMLFTLSYYHFWIKSYANFSAARCNLVNYRSSVKCHN